MEKWRKMWTEHRAQCIAVLAFLLITPIVIFALIQFNGNRSRSEMLKNSLAFDTNGFYKTQTLTLTGAYWMDAEQVMDGLSVSPATGIEVAALSEDGSYAIKLLALEKHLPYTITFTEPFGGFSLETVVNDGPLTAQLAVLNPDNFGLEDPIIIQFSDEVREDDLKEHMTIIPELSYQLACRGNMVYIRPYAPLAPGTAYSIVFDSNMPSLAGDKIMEQDRLLQINTESIGFTVKLTNPNSRMYTRQDEITLRFNAFLETLVDVESVPLTITLYSFPSLDAYLEQSEQMLLGQMDITGLTEVETFTHDLVNQTSAYVLSNPGEGAYMLDMQAIDPETGKEFHFRKAVAVTSLSVYAQTSGTQTLVWLNDSVSGQPIKGYRIAFSEPNGETLAEAVTDADGVALLNYYNTKNDNYYYYYDDTGTKSLCLYDANGALVYVDNTSVLNRYNRPTNPNRYYAFIMTDRPIYRPTDEVQFWGVLRGWDSNRDAMPSDIRVAMGEGTLDLSAPVTLAADGSFQGSFELEMARSSYYSLQLLIPNLAAEEGGEYENAELSVASEYLQVQDYKKPAYTIAATNDKAFYLPGESVTVEITPTFYDGTPMPYFNVELLVRESYYGEHGNPIRLTTDADGKAYYSFPAKQGSERNGWLPTSGGYTVRISEDGENISQDKSYRYIPSDTVAGATITKQADGKVRLNVQTAAFDLGKLKTIEDVNAINSSDYSWDSFAYSQEQFDAAKGAAKNVPVRVVAQCSWYEPVYEWVEDPNTYTSQRVRTWQWRFDTRTFDIQTAGGAATIADLTEGLEYDSKMFFSIDLLLNYADSGNRPVSTSLYWSNNGWHPGEEDQPTHSPGFNFALTNAQGVSVLDEFYYYATYNMAAFGDGDTMNFELYYQDKPAQNNGRILYTVLQEEIVQKDIITSNKLQLTQNIANANSFNLVAAYFDGTTVYPIRNTIVTFDKSSIELDVQITPDKDSYSPGETVNLEIKVTDPKGRGVAGVTGISIVDESIFALREQDIFALSDLYGDFFFDHYYVPKYTTGAGDYLMEYGMGDGGKGDGANLTFQDKLRKNFKDTALFSLVRTDQDGTATTSFTLPDNVTSWRITGVAIGDNLYAGQSKTNFVTTMPFFVQPVISTKYIDGDDIAMLIQGHGVALDENSQISYNVQIVGDGVDKTMTAQDAAYKPVLLNFGKLPQGEYTVTASASAVTGGASSATYRDAVEVPLAVINSNLELVINRIVDPQKPLEISAMRYPVTLTFYDKAHAPYYDSISSLLTHYCMMSNQRMSRFVAKRALTAHMDPDSIPQHISAEDPNVPEMQNPDGGIGGWVGDASHPAITMKVLIIAKDQFHLGQMADYFNNVISTTKDADNIAASYLGLAVIGEEISGVDITGKVTALLDKSSTSPVQQAYLIAALDTLGKEKEAAGYYEKLITPKMKSSGTGRYHSGGAPETAATWIAASSMGHADADAISLYLARDNWRFSSLFETMIYVTHYNKEVIPQKLVYKIGDEAVTLDLGAQGSQTVSFKKSEFESLTFEDVPEDIAARAYFIGEPAEADIEPSDQLSIARTITPLQNNRYRIALTVTFGENAPTGSYDISEWVPSNMRLYQIDSTNRYSGDRWWYDYSTEGQKIYFNLYRYDESVNTITLSYTAQKTYDAEAVVDSAYIIHGESGINNLTERSTIK